MAQALGVLGLQGLQVSKQFGQSLSGENSVDRLQHLQDGAGASCFRQVSLPPIVAISLTASGEELVAVKERKKGTLRTRKVAARGESSVRGAQQTAARALNVLHEHFSSALFPNIALTEDELSRYIMLPDASTILNQSILEAQWALTLEELMHEEKVRVPNVTRRTGTEKSKVARRKKEKAVEDTCTEITESTASTSAPTEELVVKSGRPSARTRRLEARQRRVAAAGKPTPSEVLMIHPLKKYQKGERPKPFKSEGVQDYLTTYLREITKIDLLTKQEEIILSKKLRIGLNLIEERKK